MEMLRADVEALLYVPATHTILSQIRAAICCAAWGPYYGVLDKIAAEINRVNNFGDFRTKIKVRKRLSN